MPSHTLPASLGEDLVAFARAYREVPMLTAYIAGGMRDPAARRQWQVVLKHGLAETARTLEKSARAEREAFDIAAAALLDAVPDEAMVHAAPGFVVFATGTGESLARKLDGPPPPSVSWQRGPRIVPAFVAGILPAAIVAIADRAHATIYRMSGGALTPLEQIATEPVVEPSRRMARTPRPGFHAGTRGGTQQDDTARKLREAADRHVARVASSIERHAEPDARVVLGGRREAVQLVATALAPTRRAGLALATGLRPGAGERAIVAAAERALRDAESGRQVEFARTLLDASRAGGHAAVGPASVIRALERGAVDTLLVSPRLVSHHAAALEQMVRDGLAEGATVAVALPGAAQPIDAQAGGVLARLRFPVPASQRRPPARQGASRKAAAASS
jgi:hypothetical protein